MRTIVIAALFAILLVWGCDSQDRPQDTDAKADPSVEASPKAAPQPAPAASEDEEKTYAVDKGALALIEDDKAFFALLQEVKADINRDLKESENLSPMLKRQYYGTLATAAFLEKRWDDGSAVMDKLAELESDPTMQKTSGMVYRALLAATRESGKTDEALFARNLAAMVNELPKNPQVQQELQMKMQKAGMLSKDMFTRLIRERIEPMAAEGRLPLQAAMVLVGVRWQFDYALAVTDEMVQVYRDALEKMKDAAAVKPAPKEAPATKAPAARPKLAPKVAPKK